MAKDKKKQRKRDKKRKHDKRKQAESHVVMTAAVTAHVMKSTTLVKSGPAPDYPANLADKLRHEPFLDFEDGQVLYQPGYLVETHGSGVVERVDGFDVQRAMTERMGLRPIGNLKAESSQVYLPPPPADVRFLGDGWIAESQIGANDDRTPVSDTSQVPWRAICHLKITYESGSSAIGTGFFVGPRCIATAGHNVVRDVEGEAAQVEIIPGRNRNIAPFGIHLAAGKDSHPRWNAQSGWDKTCDVGCFYVKDRVGQKTGWLGLASLTDQALTAMGQTLLNNAGYDMDKSPLGTQWFNAGRLNAFNANWLKYLLDTEAGQSGSPIFHKNNSGARTVLAIHTYGDSGQNYGVRFTSEIFGLLQQWAQK